MKNRQGSFYALTFHRFVMLSEAQSPLRVR